jgi:hypothetical protein
LLESDPRIQATQFLDLRKIPGIGEMVQPSYPFEKFGWIGHDGPFYAVSGHAWLGTVCAVVRCGFVG